MSGKRQQALFDFLRRRADLTVTLLDGDGGGAGGSQTPRSWAPADAEASLAAIYEHVRQDALDATRWYVEARRPKKRVATLVRFAALGTAGVAAVLPLFAELADGTSAPAWVVAFRDAGWLEPIWISIALALGAGLLAFDRFWGASSGWVRYVTTEMKLGSALEAFEMDYERNRAAWQGNPPAPEQVDAMLARFKEFAAQVNTLVEEETKTWVEEFLGSIKSIEEALKARETARREEEAARRESGAINLTIGGWERADPDTVEVSVDLQPPRKLSGKTVALADLARGMHVFKVTGTVGGKIRVIEKVVPVVAGTVADLELELD